MKKHPIPPDYQAMLVEALMELTPDQQNAIMFEYGCQYLEQRAANIDCYKKMSRSKKVWSWWVMQWQKRTSNLIYELQLDEYQDIPTPDEKARLLRHYHDLHNPTNLIIRPSRVLLEESWKELELNPEMLQPLAYEH